MRIKKVNHHPLYEPESDNDSDGSSVSSALEVVDEFEIYTSRRAPWRTPDEENDDNGKGQRELSLAIKKLDKPQQGSSSGVKTIVPDRHFMDRGYVYLRPQTSLPARKLNLRRSIGNSLDDGRSLQDFLRSRTSFYSTRNDVDVSMELPEFASESNTNKPPSHYMLFRDEAKYAYTSNNIRAWAAGLKNAFEGYPLKTHWALLQEFMNLSIKELFINEYYSRAVLHKDDAGDTKWKDFARNLWKTVFTIFGKDHPMLLKLKNIKNVYSFKDLNEEAGNSCLAELYHLKSINLNAMKLVKDWREQICDAMHKHLIMIEKLSALESSLEKGGKKRDGICYPGKNKFSFVVSAPYFKISRDDVSYLAPPETRMETVYGDAFFPDIIQKWGSRDFESLCVAIRDMVVAGKYSRLTQIRTYLLSRFTHGQFCERNERSYINTLQGKARVCKNRRVTAPSKAVVAIVKRNFSMPDKNDSLDSTFKCTAEYATNPTDTQNWFKIKEKDLQRLTYQTLMDQGEFPKRSDWSDIARCVTEVTGKERSPTDCRLIWLNDPNMNPKTRSKSWSKGDLKDLVALGNNTNLRWEDIAQKFTTKTVYQCIHKYQQSVIKIQRMVWTTTKDDHVKEVLLSQGPKWGVATKATLDVRATSQLVQDRWKKKLDPMIRRGTFTRVEDTLLLLTINDLDIFVQKDRNFRIVMGYLPWRCETVWRDRANCLFGDMTIPWTIQEDKKLIELAQSQGEKKDWRAICQQFDSYKNRKNCYTRYSILKKKVGLDRQPFKDIEEYHEAYSMTRYNVFEHKHLKEIVQLLQRMLLTQPPSSPFPGLSPDKPPLEIELRWMLLEFNKEIMKTTIATLEAYLESRDSVLKGHWTQENTIRKTFDRRKFHREDPKSVASAVHIRGLRVLSQNQVEGSPLTKFESDVQFYYARFSKTKALNRNLERPYVPSAKKLCKLPEIKRIVRISEGSSSGSDWDDQADSRTQRKRGRPKKKLIPPTDDDSNQERVGMVIASVTCKNPGGTRPTKCLRNNQLEVAARVESTAVPSSETSPTPKRRCLGMSEKTAKVYKNQANQRNGNKRCQNRKLNKNACRLTTAAIDIGNGLTSDCRISTSISTSENRRTRKRIRKGGYEEIDSEIFDNSE